MPRVGRTGALLIRKLKLNQLMIFERVLETRFVMQPPHIIRNPYEVIDRCRFVRLVIGLIWGIQRVLNGHARICAAGAVAGLCGRLGKACFRSIACGSPFPYDGAFNNKTHPSTGVTVALQQQPGIRLIAESQIAELATQIETPIQQVRRTVNLNE
ncbi:hypothetical protein SAMN05446635_3970 [Burkholderia sp. OK233]|nr:hypothetical protein SAMN05446635_3970 [Burkholderia sp. OK233]